METTSPKLKQRIMRRVYGIWFVKRVLPRLVGETIVVYIAVTQIAAHVFINHVLANAVLHTFSRSPITIFNYFANALINSEVLVQTMLMSSVVLAGFMLRDIVRASRLLSSHPQHLQVRNFSL